MKFCYIDESGKGDEPVLVMAGIIVDANRMHKTKDGWAEFLKYLSNEVNKKISEFHASDFYRGKGIWHKIDGNTRAKLISAILKWLEQRKHHITFSAIYKESFDSQKKNFYKISNEWYAAAIHCILSLQKWSQQQKNNKGNTVMIFDRSKGESGITEFVINPPKWTESFYNKKQNQEVIDQIIDVPFFADSKHALLIQIADMISYILRNYAEINMGLKTEKYQGESLYLKNYVDKIIKRTIPKVNRYPTKRNCKASQLFFEIAPKCLII